MQNIPLPWIEVSRGVELPGSAPAGAPATAPAHGYHALFAARVRVKPFLELQRLKWGWNNGALLEEALDRQRLFIESQHPADNLAQTDPPDRHTLALRCLHNPAQPHLELVVVGKVFAARLEAARESACAGWHALHSTFPYDYSLEPVTERSEFQSVSGWQWIKGVSQAQQITALQRFEGALLRYGPSAVYLLGNWQWSTLANEQIWRALAGCPQPVMLNVTLRPVVLLDSEQRGIAEMAEAAHQAASQSTHTLVRRDAEWAAQSHTDRLAELRYPYLLQIHLVAPEGVPPYLARLIGAALTHKSGTERNLPGFAAVMPPDLQSLERWRDGLLWLEPPVELKEVDFPLFARLRHMTGVREAQAAFRLPFPPEVGLPGVAIGPQTEEN